MRKNYPANWEEIREEVIEENNHECIGCQRTSTPLEIHHVIPVSQGGSHAKSNLEPVCPDCHAAAHGEQMAPTVRWYTNGDLSQDEFDEHKRIWKKWRDKLGFPRYNAEKDCIYVPLADIQKLIDFRD